MSIARKSKWFAYSNDLHEDKADVIAALQGYENHIEQLHKSIVAIKAERDALRKDAALYAGIVRIEYNDVYVAACRRQGVGPDSFDVYLEKCRAIDRAAIAAKEPNRE